MQSGVEETLVVKEFDNKKRPEPKAEPRLWKTFAVYSGAALQWGTCVVVFSYLGHLLSKRWGSPWLTAAGALLGIVVGGVGLVFLARQLLGDRGE